MLTSFRVCNPKHDTGGGELRPWNIIWISGKQRYDNGSIKMFGKRAMEMKSGEEDEKGLEKEVYTLKESRHCPLRAC